MACQALDRSTFPEERVAAEVNEHTVPLQIDVLAERDLCKKLRVPWTPTFLFVDGDGIEQHRFLGYLPADEFNAQVHFARGRDAFAKGRYEEALKAYGHVAERYPATDAAPESLYWTGVCEFKLTKDVQKIQEKCRAVVQRYPGHIWARKLTFPQ